MNEQRDTEEDMLRDAAHDAFMDFWRGATTADAEMLWLRYCTAQEQYEAYLIACRYTAPESRSVAST